MLWPERWGLWTSYCERTSVGQKKFTEAGSWSTQPAEPNAAVWQHVPWPARRALSQNEVGFSLYRKFLLQDSHIKDKEWGEWLRNLQGHQSLSRESVLARFSATVGWFSIFLTPFCGLRQLTNSFSQTPVMGQGSNQMMWDTENWIFFFSCFQALALHLGRVLPVIPDACTSLRPTMIAQSQQGQMGVTAPMAKFPGQQQQMLVLSSASWGLLGLVAFMLSIFKSLKLWVSCLRWCR